MVDRASGPIGEERLADRATQKDADVTDLPDEPLTPPRCGARLVPAAAPLEPDAWARRYPPSPPPSESPSPCRESAMPANSSSSASDAARISASTRASETAASNSTSVITTAPSPPPRPPEGSCER